MRESAAHVSGRRGVDGPRDGQGTGPPTGRGPRLPASGARRLAAVGVLLIAVLGGVWIWRASESERAMPPDCEATGSGEFCAWVGERAGPVMVRIPPGLFERSRIAAFALGKYEVTFADYDRFVEATELDLPSDQRWGRGDRPVVNVSWNDATAYARWLSAQTGRSYRLPTQAEWEYAARAGTTTRYWWGDEVGSGHANCDGCGTEWDNKPSAPVRLHGRTLPVGSFAANPLGLHDTSGNAMEWVYDCARAIDPCDERVIHGGSWTDLSQDVRSASRERFRPDFRTYNLGFRLARDPHSTCLLFDFVCEVEGRITWRRDTAADGDAPRANVTE